MKPEDLKEIGDTVKERLWWIEFMLGVLGLWALAHSCSASEIPADYANRIADAIYVAEGGTKAKVPYGILSVKVRDKAHAREVCLRTIRNNWRRWEEAGKPGEYLDFLADRYCPPTVDATGNANWKRNVRWHLAMQAKPAKPQSVVRRTTGGSMKKHE